MKFLIQFLTIWLGILMSIGLLLHTQEWWQFDEILLLGTLSITGWYAFWLAWYYHHGIDIRQDYDCIA